MFEKLKKYRLQLIFLLIGALGGFLYWKFVGCKTGTCPIKSVWYYMVLWGSAFGYLIGDLVNDYLKKGKRKNEKTI